MVAAPYCNTLGARIEEWRASSRAFIRHVLVVMWNCTKPCRGRWRKHSILVDRDKTEEERRTLANERLARRPNRPKPAGRIRRRSTVARSSRSSALLAVRSGATAGTGAPPRAAGLSARLSAVAGNAANLRAHALRHEALGEAGGFRQRRRGRARGRVDAARAAREVERGHHRAAAQALERGGGAEAAAEAHHASVHPVQPDGQLGARVPYRGVELLR